MGKYTGCQCMICQNTFREEDDIVVCPDCGTPYHRSCYASAGRCINDALHESGGSWQTIQNARRQKIGGMECSSCHHINLPDAAECAVCRKPLPHSESHTMEDGPSVAFGMSDGQQILINPMDPCCGLPPDEEIEGEKLGHIARFVGSNTFYYIPLFKRFKETGRKLSLNLSCMFFPHLYFAYRRMWLPAILVMVVSAILAIPSMLTNLLIMLETEEVMEVFRETYSSYGMDADQIFSGILALLKPYESILQNLDMLLYGVILAGRSILGLFANRIYLHHIIKNIRRIRSRTQSPEVAAALIQSEGGANAWNIIGGFMLNYGVQIGVCCALGFVLTAFLA